MHSFQQVRSFSQTNDIINYTISNKINGTSSFIDQVHKVYPKLLMEFDGKFTHVFRWPVDPPAPAVLKKSVGNTSHQVWGQRLEPPGRDCGMNTLWL